MSNDAELEATLDALVFASSRQVLAMLSDQNARPDPALVENYLAAFREQLERIPLAVWRDQTSVRLPADVADALPAEVRDRIGQALSAEILRHVHLALSPILLLLATQTWNLTMERAARVAAESKAAEARRH